MATELEDEGLQDGPPEDTDGYDWAIEEIREIVNKLSESTMPERRLYGPKWSLRTFNLINQLVDLIPSDNEPTPE